MKGIVLDFDGVLAKSMEQHAEAYRLVMQPLGVPVAERDVFIWEGARSETIIRDLAKAAGKKLSDDRVRELADEKQAIFRRLGDIQLYPGADEMVRSLPRQGVRLGLVTGTRRENVERLIPNLLPRFDAVLTQADYTRDKPDPEPYLKAAEKLRVDPSDCAALENAVRGVESARGAGYDLVVAITTTLKKQVLAAGGAHVVVSSHGEAGATLAAWTLGAKERGRASASSRAP